MRLHAEELVAHPSTGPELPALSAHWVAAQSMHSNRAHQFEDEMNTELIEQTFKVAGGHIGTDEGATTYEMDPSTFQRFAEAIVRRCADHINVPLERKGSEFADAILAEFGIEK